MLEWEEKEFARLDGREEGLAEGRAEGLAEGQMEAKLETARALLKKDIPVETVSECTGLSMEQSAAVKEG